MVWPACFFQPLQNAFHVWEKILGIKRSQHHQELPRWFPPGMQNNSKQQGMGGINSKILHAAISQPSEQLQYSIPTSLLKTFSAMDMRHLFVKDNGLTCLLLPAIAICVPCLRKESGHQTFTAPPRVGPLVSAWDAKTQNKKGWAESIQRSCMLRFLNLLSNYSFPRLFV